MFDDIIKKPKRRKLKASWTIELEQDLKAKYGFEEDEFTKDYEKWMEDYQKLSKKPVIYTPYIPLVVHEYPITKPVEFIVLNFEITKTGVSFTDV